jgi:hypothetical protein
MLCTVRDFQLRCTGGLAGYTIQNEADEIQVADESQSCRRCSLPINWCTDERLHDEELVRVARILALWEQMRSIGTSLAGFDSKQLAAACMWLVASDHGKDCDAEKKEDR